MLRRAGEVSPEGVPGMSLEEFRQLLASKSPPPPDLSPAVRSLWHDARGEWDLAHETVQTERGPEGTWVHAYLHR